MRNILYIAAWIMLMYACYWVFKTCSYTIFYEGMVEDTVREMVLEESLQ
jgi:hypothetical protein